MQTNPDNSGEKKATIPKYFPENVYKEIVKSMNDFEKNTTNNGENLNIATGNDPEITFKYDITSPGDSKSNFNYGKGYFLNQQTNTNLVTPQGRSNIQECQSVVKSPECTIAKRYNEVLSENEPSINKDEFKMVKRPKFDDSTNLESEMGSDLIKCIKSVESSPNLLPAKESYSIQAQEINSGSVIDLKTNELDTKEEEQKNFYPGVSGKPPCTNKIFEYCCINFDQFKNENLVSDPGFYFNIPFGPQIIQNKGNFESNVNYLPLHPEKEVVYFNSITPVYDPETNSYYPNYQVQDENHSNFNYRQRMFRNGHNYLIANPYEDIDSFYKSNSMKQDICDTEDQMDENNKNSVGNSRIASKATQDKKRNSRPTSAGRPKLNRNHYSCANCNVKTTPQWRYYKGVAVCNACYMRIRKDKSHLSQGTKKQKKK